MLRNLRNRINRYFVGKEEVVDLVLCCFLGGGHVLLEDVPGVGKTTLARTLADSVQCSFGRIQFTPDTLPSDVTGATVYNMKTSEFDYREGAVMRQILLADEINRTSPKTQASLLEAMAEGQVTVDGTRYALPDPFLVIATQNPIEFIGTYPLPEAQLDRFMMRLAVGYPAKEQEFVMARNFLSGAAAEAEPAVCTADDILRMKKDVAAVHVSDGVLNYIQEIIDLTRTEPKLTLGASPRALLSLVRASQAYAYLDGRDFVKPDDVKAVAVYVLHHRVVLTPEARLTKEDADSILTALIRKARIPKE
ncbi:MAG: MoxR family ATPase [Lachnospiraceae bacterium]|nr:MoxR family ATPase [Lachnospiraceae bacterium]